MNAVAYLSQFAPFGLVLLGPVPLAVLAARGGKGPPPSLHHRWLTGLASWVLLQALVAHLLGVAGLLRPAAIYSVEAALACVGWIALRRHAARRGAEGAVGRAAPELDASLRLVLAAWASVTVALAWTLASHPITDYDSLAFHLPFLAWTVQEGRPAFVSGLAVEVQRYYPYGWELLCSLFFAPFGEDSALAVPNLAAWMLWGAAIIGLGRSAGAPSLTATVAAFLVLCMPIVLDHVGSMLTDLPLAVLFTAGLAFAGEHRAHRRPVDLALFLGCLGFLPAIKTTGLGYAGVLALCFGLLGAMRGARRRDEAGRPAVPGGVDGGSVPPRRVGSMWATIGGGAALVFLATYWYARNAVATGNPLGAVGVTVAGHTLFEGVRDLRDYRVTTLAVQFDLTDPGHWGELLGGLRFYFQLPFFLLLLQVPGLLGLAARPAAARDLVAAPGFRIVVVALVLIVFVYWNTPYGAGDFGPNGTVLTWSWGSLRYGVAAVGLLAASAAAVAGRWKAPQEALLLAALVTCAAGLPKTPVYYAVMLWPLGWGAAETLARWLGRGGLPGSPSAAAGLLQRWRTGAARMRAWGAVLLALTLVAGKLVADWRRVRLREKSFGAVVEAVDQRIREDERVGFLWSHRTYLFFGTRYQRPVVYVPAGEDRDAWLRRLEDHAVDVVALGPIWNWPAGSVVEWLEDPAGPFERIVGPPTKREAGLYRLRRHSLGSCRPRGMCPSWAGRTLPLPCLSSPSSLPNV